MTCMNPDYNKTALKGFHHIEERRGSVAEWPAENAEWLECRISDC